MIDLRSDTVTKPSKEMLNAMMNAEVGDDVYGEDPTVNKLQDFIAELLGKEAALFVPSGVMANQISIKLHTQPGDEIIVERDSHIFNYETAGASFLSNVQLNTIKGFNGILNAKQIEKELRSRVYYNPQNTLICLENTHNKAGGIIYPIEEIKKINALAKTKNIALHLDGARIWNASVETGITLKEYASYFDTVSVCFSKGLCAPVGSAILGSKKLIEKARVYRKIFGGGMRQAGILAAGALYAVQNNFSRLKEDHLKAKKFAEELYDLKNVVIDNKSVQTNIVIIDVSKSSKNVGLILSELKEKGALLSEMSNIHIRAVTHFNVTLEEVLEAANMVKKVLVK